MTTQERILETARTLFNDQGTGPVSTNHIAAELGMSPGNLYYHFRNKEAIVRALFERLFARWDEVFTLPAEHTPTTADLLRLVRANFAVLWEYRFAYRELIPLLRRDPELRERWLEVRQRGYSGFHDLVAAFAAAGVLRTPANPEAVDLLADLCWLISEFWLASLEVSGEPVDSAHLDRAVVLMLHVLNPATLAPVDLSILADPAIDPTGHTIQATTPGSAT